MPYVRRRPASRQALGDLGDERAVEPLRRALDSDEEISAAVREALAKLAGGDAEPSCGSSASSTAPGSAKDAHQASLTVSNPPVVQIDQPRLFK